MLRIIERARNAFDKRFRGIHRDQFRVLVLFRAAWYVVRVIKRASRQVTASLFYFYFVQENGVRDGRCMSTAKVWGLYLCLGEELCRVERLCWLLRVSASLGPEKRNDE